MLNLVSDAESQGSSETYFQDQPVLMKLEFLSERIACFSVGSRKHILPRERGKGVFQVPAFLLPSLSVLSQQV